MLTAYFDDSGTPDAADVVVLGGRVRKQSSGSTCLIAKAQLVTLCWGGEAGWESTRRDSAEVAGGQRLSYDLPLKAESDQLLDSTDNSLLQTKLILAYCNLGGDSRRPSLDQISSLCGSASAWTLRAALPARTWVQAWCLSALVCILS
jgi:hypothetical protein